MSAETPLRAPPHAGVGNPTATAESKAVSAENPQAVALVVVGEIRDMAMDPVFGFGVERWGRLVRPLLQEFGRARVHLYLCVGRMEARFLLPTGQNPARAMRRTVEAVRAKFRLGGPRGLRARAIFEHADVGSQRERLERCFDDVEAHARGSGGGAPASHPPAFDWYVRSRPDLAFHGDLPPIRAMDPGAVHARGFRFGGGYVRGPGAGFTTAQTSSWDIANKASQHGSCDRRCVFKKRGALRATEWRGNAEAGTLFAEESGTESGLSGELGTYSGWDADRVPERCLVIDDMFAVVPARFAPGYFAGRPAPAAPGGAAPGLDDDAYPAVAGFASCQWPEGALTCRVQESGARLALLSLPIILNKLPTPGGFVRWSDEMAHRAFGTELHAGERWYCRNGRAHAPRTGHGGSAREVN
jgi:hypothetical protein